VVVTLLANASSGQQQNLSQVKPGADQRASTISLDELQQHIAESSGKPDANAPAAAAGSSIQEPTTLKPVDPLLRQQADDATVPTQSGKWGWLPLPDLSKARAWLPEVPVKLPEWIPLVGSKADKASHMKPNRLAASLSPSGSALKAVDEHDHDHDFSTAGLLGELYHWLSHMGMDVKTLVKEPVIFIGQLTALVLNTALNAGMIISCDCGHHSLIGRF